MSINKVSVIGAGPAGLTAAYFLSKKNIKPVVYESSKSIGGLAGSISLWGKQYDIGPHIFLESSQPAAVDFWKEIGGNDLLRLTLSRGMVLNNRIIRFPPAPAGLLKAIGPFAFCKAAVHTLKAKLSAGRDINNAGDFFQNNYGDYFRKLVFNPFCEKYMGIPDAQVDTGFATGLTSFVKEAGKTDVQPEKEKLKTLLYPKHGTKMMWTRLAEKVGETGEIIFEKKLEKIITNGNRIESLCFNDGTVTEADFVVSTLPVTTLLRLLDNCPAPVMNEAKKLTSRNTVLVYLRVAAKAFSHQYITAFDHSLEAGRITNFNSWQVNADDKDTVLCVEYWCDATHENWTCTNEAIIAKAVAELEKIKIISGDKITAAEVMHLPYSHPVLSTGYNAALNIINNYLSGFTNLALAGRHATFKWDGQADNIIAGMKLAEHIEKNLQ